MQLLFSSSNVFQSLVYLMAFNYCSDIILNTLVQLSALNGGLIMLLLIGVLIVSIIMYASMYLIEKYENSKAEESAEELVPKEKNISVVKLENTVYSELRKKIDDMIINDLQECEHESLREMLLYSLDGGKRVRTVIMLSLNPDIDIDKILAIEYLHASSLIIDDIMDGDKERRNKKCLHILHNNTMAQMAAIYLLSLSMNKVAKFGTIDDNKEFAKTFNELCIGQFMDVDNKTYDIEKLIKYKTSVLFQLSYYFAAEKDQQETYKELGIIFGDIFQISDDYDDKEKDKTKNNSVLTKGQRSCRKLLNNKIHEYKTLAKYTNSDNALVDHIINYLNYKTLI